MGQYHHLVNLDKREYLEPHRLGMGLKLWEQATETTGLIMMALLSISNGRGGGDFNGEYRHSADVIGRWKGDRIAVVGDYSEDGDLPEEFKASEIYDLLGNDEDNSDTAYTDITDMVCAFVEDAREGVFYGTGWRQFITTGPVERWAEPYGTGVKEKGTVVLANHTDGVVVDWPSGRETYTGDGPTPYLMQ